MKAAKLGWANVMASKNDGGLGPSAGISSSCEPELLSAWFAKMGVWLRKICAGCDGVILTIVVGWEGFS